MSSSLRLGVVSLVLLLTCTAPAGAEALRVRGVAADVAQKPVAGADVTVRQAEAPYATLATTKSDADGAFTADLEEEAPRLTIEVRKSGFAPSLLVNVAPALIDVDVGAILLLEPVTLRGTATLPDGKPAAGATVVVTTPTDRAPRPCGTTDANGGFRVDDLPPALVTVGVLVRGAAWTPRVLDLADPRARTVTLALGPGTAIHGVTEPGALVRFVPKDPRDPTAPPPATADSAGAFDLLGVAANAAGVVRVTAFGLAPLETPLERLPADGKLVLAAAAVVRATLVAGKGETAPALRSIHADVFTKVTDPKLAGPTPSWTKSEALFTAADADSVQVEPGGAWRVTLPPGERVRLALTAADGRTATAQDVMILARGKDAPIDASAALEPRRLVTGIVVGADGAPVAGAIVRLDRPNSGAIREVVAHRMRAGADGAFRFEGVEGGTWGLSAETEDLKSATTSLDASATPSTEGLKVVLAPAASIAGKVTLGGAPPSVPIVVSAMRYLRSGLEGEWTAVAAARADKDGRYRLAPLDPGFTLLAVRPLPEAESGSLRDWSSEAPPISQNGWPWLATIEQPAQRALVDLALDAERPVHVLGTVAVNGVPRGGLRVTARSVSPAKKRGSPWLAGQRFAESDPDGRFRLRLDGPGDYELEVTGGHLDQRSTHSFGPGKPAEVALDVAAGAVTGRLGAASGTGTLDVATIRVQLERPALPGPGHPVADWETFTAEQAAADGAFRFADVPAGRWRVLTLDTTGKRAAIASAPFDVAAGQAVELPALALPLGVFLEVSLKKSPAAKDPNFPYAALAVSAADAEPPLARDFQGWFVDGKAHVGSLPPGKVKVHVKVYGPWRAGDDQVVSLPQDGTKVTLEFEVGPTQ